MTTTIAKHPAVWTAGILTRIHHDIEKRGYSSNATLLDPFAGTGKIHELAYRTVGIELEPEWAAVDYWAACGQVSICADSLGWMEKTRRRFDLVVTSCCYGNRMADHHEANDKCSQCKGTGQEFPGDGTVKGLYPDCPKCKGSGLSTRRSYRHDLGRMPSEGSSATMHYGPEYRAFHRRAWAGVYRVTKPGGHFYLNSKDFVRNKKIVRVSDWHRRTCIAAGFVHVGTIKVPVKGMLYGENRRARVAHELVYIFQKPEA